MKILFESKDGEQTIIIQIGEMSIKNQTRFNVNGWKIEDQFILSSITILFGMPCICFTILDKEERFFAWEAPLNDTYNDKDCKTVVLRKILSLGNICKNLGNKGE